MNKLQTVLNKVKPLGAIINTDKVKMEALDWTNEITQAGGMFSSPFVPADLRQKNSRSIRTRSGKLVSGFTLATDWTHGDDSGMKPLVVSLMFAGLMSVNTIHTVTSSGFGISSTMTVTAGLGLFAYKLLVSPTFFELVGMGLVTAGSIAAMSFASTSFLGSAIAYAFPGAVLAVMNHIKNRARAMNLRDQAINHLSDKGENLGNATEPQVMQIVKAIQDDAKSPFIPFGTTTGTLQNAGDMKAPDANTVIGTTLSELFMHLIILGKSGTGKTWFIRYVADAAVKASAKLKQMLGILALDGKGDLPFEIAKLLDYIIHPAHIKNFNPIDGVSAEKWRLIIETANNTANVEGNNKIFSVLAGDLIYYTALAHEFMRDLKVKSIKYNLSTRYKLMPKMFELGENQIISILKQHPDFATNPFIKDTIAFIESNQTEERQELSQSVLANAQSWLSAFFQQEELRAWAECEISDVDVRDVLHGAKIGVALPVEKFGKAGLIISQVVKTIVRNAIANRESNWRDTDSKATSVLLLQDEFQDLINDDDKNNIQKDRSRGCINIVATQSISGIVAKLGKVEIADAFLGAFSSQVALFTGDKMSNDYLQHLAGWVRSMKSSMPLGDPIDFRYTAEQMAKNPDFDANHPDAGYLKGTRSEFKFHHMQNGKAIETNRGFFSGLFGIFRSFFHISESIGLATYQSDVNHPYKKVLSDYDLGKLERTQWAFVRVKRAGQYRQDFAVLNGLSPDFK